jgi:hypothetical protein
MREMGVMLLWVRQERGAGSIYRRHIGGEDRGETAFDGLLHGLPQLRRS